MHRRPVPATLLAALLLLLAPSAQAADVLLSSFVGSAPEQGLRMEFDEDGIGFNASAAEDSHVTAVVVTQTLDAPASAGSLAAWLQESVSTRVAIATVLGMDSGLVDLRFPTVVLVSSSPPDEEALAALGYEALRSEALGEPVTVAQARALDVHVVWCAPATCEALRELVAALANDLANTRRYATDIEDIVRLGLPEIETSMPGRLPPGESRELATDLSSLRANLAAFDNLTRRSNGVEQIAPHLPPPVAAAYLGHFDAMRREMKADAALYAAEVDRMDDQRVDAAQNWWTFWSLLVAVFGILLGALAAIPGGLETWERRRARRLVPQAIQARAVAPHVSPPHAAPHHPGVGHAGLPHAGPLAQAPPAGPPAPPPSPPRPD